MNKLIIKGGLGVLGLTLGLAMLFFTWRTGVGMAIGSGLFGASILAILVAVLGTLIAVLILTNSFKYLLSLNKKETTNES